MTQESETDTTKVADSISKSELSDLLDDGVAMTEQRVDCPWCGYGFYIGIPPDVDPIMCPACKKPCDYWADGDIDLSYYLTQHKQ